MSTHVPALTDADVHDARLHASMTDHAVTLVVDGTHQIATVLPSGRVTVRNEP